MSLSTSHDMAVVRRPCDAAVAHRVRSYKKRQDLTLALLHLTDHALALALLGLGEHVLFAGERILAVTEIDADRRAFQLEALAEEVFQVAPIGRGDVLGAAAMNDDGRRVAATRMRKTQLGRMTTHQRRLIALVGALQGLGELG